MKLTNSIAALMAIMSPSMSSANKGFGSCPSPSVVQDFDVTKYDGKWYEVMHSSDNILETGWECVTESYSKLNDGTDNYLIHTPYRRWGKYSEWAKGQ